MTADHVDAESQGVRIQHNLCDPNREVGGFHFDCPEKSDGQTVFPCTGSEHRFAGITVECTCKCHGVTRLYFDKEFTV